MLRRGRTAEVRAVLRTFILSSCAMAALAGCAVTNTPYPRPSAENSVYPPRAPVPNMYTNAARAPLHSELFPCNDWGSNLGQIGARGQVETYTPYITTRAGPLLRNPTEAACLSSGFGWRGSSGRQHSGLDLANRSGGYIYAAGAGRVTLADWYGGYGTTLELDHGFGVKTLYAHLSEIDPNLRVGSMVEAGQAVARMGQSGNATGVHVHYEVRIDCARPRSARAVWRQLHDLLV